MNIVQTTSGLLIYGSLSTGCRICFSEDFHLHICHDEPLLFRRKAEKRIVELSLGKELPEDTLGLRGTEPLDVVNFKCDPILIGSLRGEPGIFPAYHMNKEQWLTAALDGSVSDEQIKMLLDMSYEATASKK